MTAFHWYLYSFCWLLFRKNCFFLFFYFILCPNIVFIYLYHLFQGLPRFNTYIIACFDTVSSVILCNSFIHSVLIYFSLQWLHFPTTKDYYYSASVTTVQEDRCQTVFRYFTINFATQWDAINYESVRTNWLKYCVGKFIGYCILWERTRLNHQFSALGLF